METRQTPLHPKDIPIGVEIPYGTYRDWDAGSMPTIRVPAMDGYYCDALPGWNGGALPTGPNDPILGYDDIRIRWKMIKFHRTSSGWIRRE